MYGMQRFRHLKITTAITPSESRIEILTCSLLKLFKDITDVGGRLCFSMIPTVKLRKTVALSVTSVFHKTSRQ